MSIFRVEPFDDRAAVELADAEIAIRAKGGKRGSVPEAPWQKVKFDRQIIAISKFHGVRCIYSDDPDIEKHGKDCGLNVVTLSDLPLPPAVQIDLLLNLVPVEGDPSQAQSTGDADNMAPINVVEKDQK